MKTIIYLTLCLMAVSALSPVENLSSALELLDLQDLLDDCKGFELSASFTYLGGTADDNSDVDGQVTTIGTYNLIKWDDSKGKTKTGTFNNTKNFTAHGIVKFTGSGSFNSRGGGSDKQGLFNGGSSTDFVFETDNGWAAGIREHKFVGEFKNHRSWGTGNIDVAVWQDVNSSNNYVEYTFGDQRYSGSSKAEAQVTTPDSNEYKSFLKSVFHGINTKDTWQVSGGYVWDVYNSNWDNVYSKDGAFSKNGTQDDAFGSFAKLRTFGLPSVDVISE